MMNLFDPGDAVKNARETKAADRSFVEKLREQDQTNIGKKNKTGSYTWIWSTVSRDLNFERRNLGNRLCSFCPPTYSEGPRAKEQRL